MCLQVINKVKVTHQGEGHINVKVSLQILCSPYSLQAGGLHLTEMLLVKKAGGVIYFSSRIGFKSNY